MQMFSVYKMFRLPKLCPKHIQNYNRPPELQEKGKPR
jgi:hypothetical protein